MTKAVLAAAVLLLLLGSSLPAGAVFPAEPEERWACGEVMRPVQAGEVVGQAGGKLRPDVPLIWGEWLKALGQAFCPQPYRSAVLRCYARELLAGTEEGGADPMTRGADLLLYALERAGQLPPPPEEGGEQTPPEPEGPTLPAADDPLRLLGDNSAKRIRLYGTAERSRYASEAEAQEHMTQVTVPVWHLDKESGEKTGSTITFSVNAALAEDMVAIFTAIYEDPERFPIYAIGGYDWRGDTATGEHNCGTAIDINYNENYQIYPDGRIGAGSHWTPGEDPWSIPEEGSVVRIFNAYGYTWGGNAWPTNKDYMHFSYLGV